MGRVGAVPARAGRRGAGPHGVAHAVLGRRHVRLRAAVGGARVGGAGAAANGGTVPSSRLDGEVGYGMAVWGDRFTGTPHVGFGMSDTAREVRMGWRLAPAAVSGPALNLDAVRREAVDGEEAEHGVMLRSLVRW